MSFEDAMKQAAKIADQAVSRAMQKYASGLAGDEEDITGVLIGNLDTSLSGNIGGLQWSSSIVRHGSGRAAEEKFIGADLLIHVKIETPLQSYSKGVLVQAKRVDRAEQMTSAEHKRLKDQCNTMLNISPAAWVFDYARGKMRCASATKISGSSERRLFRACDWTSYRFFLELFRCPIGDRKLTSASVKDLHIPDILKLSAEGGLLQHAAKSSKKKTVRYVSHSVLITPDNPLLSSLELSWKTVVFTDEDGIGSLQSLHEAGDAIVAVASIDDRGNLPCWAAL